MENVKIAFQIKPNGDEVPNDYHYVDCHMVFGIKMDVFLRKACLVAGGFMTHTPDAITFSSVNERETVCIALIMVALHDLKVKAADIMNVYVMAPNREKI